MTRSCASNCLVNLHLRTTTGI